MNIHNFTKVTKWLLILAYASFFLSLFFSYIGEEGVYTIGSYEMWYHHHYLFPSTYGFAYWRPPLFNWLIIFFANFLGWRHMLVASRLVTMLATLGTSFMIMWLINRLFRNLNFSLFATLIYLTSDALFYHGWLAYSDPLFAFFVVSSICFLWIANLEQRYSLVWLSAIFLIAAFMTKALTAYAFYLVAFFFIIFYDQKLKSFLIKPFNFLPYIFSIFFYFFWNIISHKVSERGMWIDILNKFYLIDLRAYMQQLVIFPLQIFCRFLPASGLAIYFFIKNKHEKMKFNQDKVQTLLALTLFSLIPYWLAPQTSIRYILPLYPFIGLLLAIVLWNCLKTQLKTILIWLAFAILMKYLALVLIYYYQFYYRGDYVLTAKQTVMQTQEFPLYSDDFVATGLSLTAEIDSLIYPKPPLTASQWAKEKNYFVINDKIDPKLGKFFKRIQIGKQETFVYLLCQGKACYSE